MKTTSAPKSNRTLALLPVVQFALLLSLLSGANGQPCAPTPPGMVGWWPAENSGTNILGGPSVTGASFSPGKVGQAFAFDGSSYATVQGGVAFSPATLSIEGWFNIGALGPVSRVLVSEIPTNNDAGWSIDAYDTGQGRQVRFTLLRGATIGQVVSAGAVPSTWAHIAATHDGTNASIYINGALQGTAIFTGGYTPTGVPMLIAGASWCESYGCSGYNFHLIGQVDELSIYSRALASAEIQAIYAAGSIGKCPAGSPPIITSQPTNQTVSPGSNASFSVAVTGSAPFFYQWLSYPTNILVGQTNATLVISNAQLGQSGWYSVAVSNTVSVVVSTNAALILNDNGDCNGNGIPNWWEALYGLDPCNPTNALSYPAGDRLTYAQKYLYGLNPLTPDTDGDGISDYDEIFVYHSNPTNVYSAGDGIPDGWKVNYGLNPVANIANSEASFDGVTYMQIYQYNLTNLASQLNPTNAFSVGPGLSNYEIINGGQHTNRFYYDHEDRLLGAEYSRGISIAYRYDGNGNLTNQAVLPRASETNGLPVLWRYLNGLTNGAPGSGPYDDPDADGWSNYQEWLAGTDPRDANSSPNSLGNTGMSIGSLSLPFTPSNFVVGVGQLDAVGPEEIVIGADGNPGTNVNFLQVLTQTTSGWSTQRVDVGSFGITSIAVGQVTNRPSAGIYVGLRGTTNGNGRVMEFTSVGGTWQSNLVALSTNQAAFVLGVRGQDVLASLAASNAPDGSLSALRFTTNWSRLLMDTNISHRGLGSLFQPRPQTTQTGALRLLDSGRISAAGTLQFSASLVSYWKLDESSGNAADSVGANTLTNYNTVTYSSGLINNGATFGTGGSFKYLGRSDALGFTADGARSFSMWVKMTATAGAQQWFFNLRINQTSALNCEYVIGCNPAGTQVFFYKDDNSTHLPNTVQIAYNITLGTTSWHHLVGTTDGTTMTFYVDGTPVGTVADFISNGKGDFTSYTYISTIDRPSYFSMDEVGVWSRALSASEVNLLFGNGYGVPNLEVLSGILLPETSATRTNNWRGTSLASGFLRGTNGSSIFYTFADDKNANGVIDSRDEFLTAEYLVSGTNASLLTLFRQPIAALTPAQSYGLASVNFLNANNEVFFTGEPDGQVFAWAPTGATNALQRQLFSARYLGKAWHALAGVKTLDPGKGLIGLMVDPTNQSTCKVIFWPPQSSLPTLMAVPETAPSAAVLPSPNPLGALADVTNRLWDAEGNASTPFLQFQFSGSTYWSNATITKLDGVTYDPTNRVAALPGGVNHTLTWNVMADLGAAVITNILLRARAQDFMLVGDWSLPTPFQVNMVQDSNGNGIPDWWEYLYFGSLQPGNGDFDGDGVSNYAEYIADTNPNDANSFLHITSTLVDSNGVHITWSGGTQARQFVQRTPGLGGTNVWTDIQTNQPPTATTGTYVDAAHTNKTSFYRIRVERP